jgi:membrane protein implicated in regulation of membrane protease activity
MPARSRLEESEAPALRTFTRYLLLESPGWLLAILVAVALHRWLGVSAPAIALLVVVWIGKDLVFYPWVRDAYAGDTHGPKELLLGQTGVVVKPLGPVGVVRVGAELWRAEPEKAGTVTPRGRAVRVREVRGLTLVVTEIGEQGEVRLHPLPHSRGREPLPKSQPRLSRRSRPL